MSKTIYQAMKDCSSQMKEVNDCSVIATAVVTRSDYSSAHALLKKFGRVDNKGTVFGNVTKPAIESLGYKIEEVDSLQKNNSRYTPKTVSKKCKEGYYLCRIKGHIFAVVDGQVMDWTEGRKHPIRAIYKVTKI